MGYEWLKVDLQHLPFQARDTSSVFSQLFLSNNSLTRVARGDRIISRLTLSFHSRVERTAYFLQKKKTTDYEIFVRFLFKKSNKNKVYELN